MNYKYVILFCIGIFWMIAYVDIIRVGFKHQTFGMPFVALALNISWEIYFTTQGVLYNGAHMFNIINFIWAGLDVLILYTYIKYNESTMTNNRFYTMLFMVLMISFVVQYYFGSIWGQIIGGIYSAFWSNLLMSILFIQMFYKRKNLKGQTLVIAWSKCIGTFLGAILVGLIGVNSIGGKISSVLYIGYGILFFDLWYIYLLYKKRYQIKNKSTVLGTI